jgi:hydrophobe/amphiphile efflux-1 (HAE1) family protein
MRGISEAFIRRPIATSLVAAAVLLAGAAAYSGLAVAPLPRVDFPTLQVNASMPGASPETMASAVAMPLERRFGRIAGITEITSTSSLGAVNLTLQFDLDRDVDSAARDVQAAINAAGGELPSNLPSQPTYRKANPADAPIMVLALTSETLPLGQIFDVASSVLVQKISQVPGVGQVMVGGGQQPAVRVQADPAALAARGLTLEDVRAVLGQATVSMPKGALQGPIQAYGVAANDGLLGAAAYGELVLAYRKGAAVRLRDVAQVVDDVENSRLAAWVDNTRAVLMIVRRQPDANILETIARVRALLPRLHESISPAIRVEVATDRSQMIRASVHDVEWTLVLTCVLVVAVVFAFLRSARATAIPSVAVPLSLVGTFGVMYLLDYSLDNLSLMALTISTGFVVDDAIVVTENIVRYLEAGDSPRQAALRGAQQVGFTIVSITASLLAVFIPILLMGGVVGRLFREFAVVLSVAIGISAAVSLTITPVMCAQLLRHGGAAPQRGLWYRASERVLTAWARLYERGLRWSLAHRRVVLGLTLATVISTLWLFVVVPKGLFPQQDTGLITAFSEAPQEISFAAMRERQQALNAVVGADPAVRHVVSFIGAANGTAGNTGTMFVELKPLEERGVSAEAVIARLRPKLAAVRGIRLFLQAAQDVRVGGRPARTQYQYTLQGANLEELRAWAPRVLARLRQLALLRDVASDQQTAGLEEALRIDRDTAARLGVTAQAIDDTLYDAFGQRQVAITFTERGQYRAILEVLPELQGDPDALAQLYVRSLTGAPVPLDALVSHGSRPTPLAVNHQGQFAAVTLSFNLGAGVALGDAVAAIRAAEAEIGLPPSIHAAFQGTAQAFRASVDTQPLLIGAALILVYIVLGVLYESLVHPITILSTLPSAGVGALLALLLCHTELSIIALIGILLLIGIVKKNAIMIVDFALEAERDAGLPALDAIYQACVMRFRPIMMTTLAAALGAVPLAVGTGTGAELRRPLGIVIVGGLLVSQVLTLYSTPVVYLAMHRLDRWRSGRRTPAAGGLPGG